MEIILEKRRLNDKEIDALVEEIKKFPNPITSKKSWQSFEKVYIAKTADKDFIGVCGTKMLNGWFKLGPFVVFQKYHGQGYGKRILKIVITDNPNDNLFIGSRNPVVAKIAVQFGFHEEKNIFKVPLTILLYLLGYVFQNLSLEFFKEMKRKNPTQEGPYRVFLKPKKVTT